MCNPRDKSEGNILTGVLVFSLLKNNIKVIEELEYEYRNLIYFLPRLHNF